MSYTKLTTALVRANKDNLNRIRLSSGRLRSTAASTQPKEKSKEPPGEEYALVKPVQVDFISQTKNVGNAQPGKVEIDFENTKEAYRSKDNIELLRSLLVFKLCTFDILVDKNKEVSCLLFVVVVVVIRSLHVEGFYLRAIQMVIHLNVYYRLIIPICVVLLVDGSE